jgi:hypothetical protein
MLTIKLITVSKKKNSTLQPDFSNAREESVSLKAPTSEEAPSFLLNWESGAFPYNYLLWGDHYYWINNVTYERNNLIRLDCTLDVLATYKSYILASTQFVAYSSVSGGVWLPDRRLQVLSNTKTSANRVQLPNMSRAGVYVVTVLGSGTRQASKGGCVTYIMRWPVELRWLISALEQENLTLRQDIMQGFSAGSSMDDTPAALESLGKVVVQTELLGNAFQNAVSCLRSCIWVPFRQSNTGDLQRIFLGNYDTGSDSYPLNDPIYSEDITVPIPWQFSDWRRVYCEDLYIYLLLVGIVSLNPEQLTGESSLTVTASYCYTDGAVAYEIKAGSQIIGTYGGNCAAQIPMGINQQTSIGQVARTAIEGYAKTTGSLFAGNVPTIHTATQAVASMYQVADVAMKTNPSIIGGIGGGAGSRLDLDIVAISVAHDLVINPGDQAATMGLPTQKPLQLSNCSGYCQCINAHVSAPAHGDSLNAIDVFLNSGFYIE